MIKKSKQLFFRDSLLNWNETLNDRQMPWKGEKDPYKIWLSEVILQQTRVDQGLAYYRRFVEKYPSVKKLALAQDTAVFKLWEGLGYYSRCKNLLASARYIADELDGKFPDEYESIVSLKGVGAYTASAIASFAFNLPYAVVDGNVSRVLSRFFGIDTPIDTTAGKKIFILLAGELLDEQQPGIYNQAIMDFGATVCKPQLPLCGACLLQTQCDAFATGKVNMLPVKEKKLVKKDRWFYYAIAEYKDKIMVRKRTGKDIWQNLHEFILLEEAKETAADFILEKHLPLLIGTRHFTILDISATSRQLLTHQTIYGCFLHIKLSAEITLSGYEWQSKAAVKKLAFPGFINAYMTNAAAFKK